MNYQKIVEFQPEHLFWRFETNQLPYFNLKGVANPWNGKQIPVDPFPCTPHDKALLERYQQRIEEIFPIGTLLQWVIVPFEVDTRTNAWASSTHLYSSDEQDRITKTHKLEGQIVMSGKRTIIHPAMTKYLVAHEYGHQVDYWISKCMQEQMEDGTGSSDTDVFRKKYAAFRGVEFSFDYGGGRWKNNIQEIIADDFRIAMGGTDVDFFVHDKVPHPLTDNKVLDYWTELKDQYAFKQSL
jgi:hypothetical protein